MRKWSFVLIALILVASYVPRASAGECIRQTCDMWLNCIDPDDAQTKNICAEQQSIARGYTSHSDIAEKFHKRELFGGCAYFAVCAPQDSGACGWQEAAQEYRDCRAHPEKYK